MTDLEAQARDFLKGLHGTYDEVAELVALLRRVRAEALREAQGALWQRYLQLHRPLFAHEVDGLLKTLAAAAEPAP